MSGDSLNLDRSASFTASDSNHLNGALAFGVDLSQPQLLAQTYRPQSSEVDIFKLCENRPGNNTTNDGPIGPISPPPGWTELVPQSPPPGTYAFRVSDGQSFVPPDHALNPSVAIHIGHGLDAAPPQAEAALRQVLQAKPATNGEQQLTAAEFTAIAPIIGAQDGGNNQFHDLGVHGPRFNVTSASTVNIDGRTALLVKGNFQDSHSGPGLARESIYVDNTHASVDSNARIQEIYLTAAKEQIQQYEKPFWDSLNNNRHRTYTFTVDNNALST